MKKAILFDFDGTLVDTAPDLAGALNDLRVADGLEPLPYAALRPVASQGARGLLAVGYQMTPQDPHFARYRTRFLQRYEQRLTQEFSIFPQIDDMLQQLEQNGYLWGIVTNKPRYLTEPLVQHLGWEGRYASLVCGDTTPTPKPHPAPLLLAAQQMQVSSHQCIYVGDDIRDIQAGKAAGMQTIAVAYGYCGQDTPIRAWQADVVVEHSHTLFSGIQQLIDG